MKQITFLFISFTLLLTEIGPRAQASDMNNSAKRLSEFLKAQKYELSITLDAKPGPYPLRVHSEEIASRLKPSYEKAEVQSLKAFLDRCTHIQVRENGLVQAADRPLNSLDDPTHYDAIWVRDTLWVYLGLRTQNREDDAKRVLLKMLHYLASPEQVLRLRQVIQNPALLKKKDGPMRAVHIRFDGKSPTFQDIQIQGKPQTWNHKQNDALGLFYDLILRAIQEGSVKTSDLLSSHLIPLALLPAYFEAIQYFQMEDAGSWEEIERVNTSSIGLVTSALETLHSVLTSSNENLKSFQINLLAASPMKEAKRNLDPQRLLSLIDQGYQAIFLQLKKGGESPNYPRKSKKYRTADAALLNLIYPARLSRLKTTDKEGIIKTIQPLIGEVGIRRYLLDSYQSGNFWLNPQQEGSTDDTSSAEDFVKRSKQFIEGTEAQWFFDSWYSKVMGILARETGKATYRDQQLQFFNRSLAQITGGSKEKPMIGADGQPVAEFALPESYNTIVKGKQRFFVPSPITPLNWAKASLSIAIEELSRQ